MIEDKNLWVVIPAYNEAKRVGNVIKEVKKFTQNIILIDDGSIDQTAEVGKEEKIIVLRHITNLGKGAGAKTGADFALKNGAEKIILIDADGQHEPKEIPRFLEALKSKDIVFGYRKFTKKMPFIFRFGNKFLNFATKVISGVKLKDTQCGYRMFTANAYKKIRWNSSDYTMESEMIANAGKHRLKYAEIKIDTIYPERYKGTTALDGVKIVFDMLFWRLRR